MHRCLPFYINLLIDWGKHARYYKFVFGSLGEPFQSASGIMNITKSSEDVSSIRLVVAAQQVV